MDNPFNMDYLDNEKGGMSRMSDTALTLEREDRIHAMDEGEIQAALQDRNPHTSRKDIRTLARIVSLVVDFVIQLPKAERGEIARNGEHFQAALEEAAQSVERVHIEGSGKVERTTGSGLGEVLSLAAGRAQLADYALPKPMEEWAGPVVGAGEILKRFGIARSTLNSWYHQGAVVGLLRGQRKLAYPLEQFIDGRPLEGLGDILKIAPDARTAWHWMRQPQGALDAKTPLGLLKEGKKELAIQQARRDFD